jgi:hypothetical protein
MAISNGGNIRARPKHSAGSREQKFGSLKPSFKRLSRTARIDLSIPRAAFFCPTRTTSRYAGIKQITLQHGVVLRHDWDYHGRVFRPLALVNGCGVCGHQGVELAEAVGDRTPVEPGGSARCRRTWPANLDELQTQRRNI